MQHMHTARKGLSLAITDYLLLLMRRVNKSHQERRRVHIFNLSAYFHTVPKLIVHLIYVAMEINIRLAVAIAVLLMHNSIFRM